VTPQQAMDAIARQMDDAMRGMHMAKYSPQLNLYRDPYEWLTLSGAPKPVRSPERPRTIAYDELIRQWAEE
jgi:hypothetical protein